MPGKTYKMRGAVLRKVKLGEKDLIVTLLDESGSLIRCVAKGARKPGGSLAAKLELFSTVDLMLARGRSLDIVADARLAGDSAPHAFGLEQAACASALAELLCAVAQEGLPSARLFDMAARAFDAMGSLGARDALAVAAASLLKALAMAGFKPSFETCVSCGREAGLDAAAGTVAFSVSEGGAVCARCQPPSDVSRVDAGVLRWCNALLLSRFDDVAAMGVDPGLSFEALQIARQWVQVHAGKSLKSLDFLFSCGLF